MLLLRDFLDVGFPSVLSVVLGMTVVESLLVPDTELSTADVVDREAGGDDVIFSL